MSDNCQIVTIIIFDVPVKIESLLFDVTVKIRLSDVKL